jgi:hypothetical protein
MIGTQRFWQRIFVGAAVAAAGLYAWLALPMASSAGVGARFDWPDETANYFFAQQFSRTGQLKIAEPLNQTAANQIHPRSVNVTPAGELVPGGFLGLPILYGAVGRVLGGWSLFLITPLLAVLGAIAWRRLMRPLFDEPVATLSALIVLFHPAWWYYAATPLLPNIASVAFLLLGLSVFVSRGDSLARFGILRLVGAGALIGLSLAIRPSEIVWVAIATVAMLLLVRERLRFTSLIWSVLGGVLVLGPLIWQQHIVYGGWITSGYAQLSATPVETSWWQVALNLLMPFGIHPRVALANVWTHIVLRLLPLAILAAFGGLVIVFNRHCTRRQLGFVMMAVAISGFLTLYYGSWTFDDQTTVHLNRLGVSYVRYWLPVYVLMTPFIASGLVWLGKRAGRYRLVLLSTVMIIGVGASAYLTLWQHPDSLLPVRERIAGYKMVAAQVNQLTEPNAVIVTARKDKVFFPDRRVIHSFEPLAERADLEGIISKLRTQTPVYYYALRDELATPLSFGLSLTEVRRFGGEILYRVQ